MGEERVKEGVREKKKEKKNRKEEQEGKEKKLKKKKNSPQPSHWSPRASLYPHFGHVPSTNRSARKVPAASE